MTNHNVRFQNGRRDIQLKEAQPAEGRRSFWFTSKFNYSKTYYRNLIRKLCLSNRFHLFLLTQPPLRKHQIEGKRDPSSVYCTVTDYCVLSASYRTGVYRGACKLCCAYVVCQCIVDGLIDVCANLQSHSLLLTASVTTIHHHTVVLRVALVVVITVTVIPSLHTVES